MSKNIEQAGKEVTDRAVLFKRLLQLFSILHFVFFLCLVKKQNKKVCVCGEGIWSSEMFQD